MINDDGRRRRRSSRNINVGLVRVEGKLLVGVLKRSSERSRVLRRRRIYRRYLVSECVCTSGRGDRDGHSFRCNSGGLLGSSEGSAGLQLDGGLLVSRRSSSERRCRLSCRRRALLIVGVREGLDELL